MKQNKKYVKNPNKNSSSVQHTKFHPGLNNKEISNFAYQNFVSNVKKKIVNQPGIQRIDVIGAPFNENLKKQCYLSHLSSTKTNNNINIKPTEKKINNSNKNINNNFNFEENNNSESTKEIDCIINKSLPRILQSLVFTNYININEKVFIRNKYSKLF